MEKCKCNTCGREFKDDGLYNEFHNPKLHKFEIKFGYGSKFDKQIWILYKCDDCLAEEVINMPVFPRINEYCLVDF